MDTLQDRLISLIIAIPALVAGLTVHEFAHAWAAYRLGDTHAKSQGRLTLDPLAHLDPLGTIFIVLAWLSGFLVGWAKPVPIDVRALRNPRRDSMWVALAGPISNMIQAPIWLLMLGIHNYVAQRAGWITSSYQIDEMFSPTVAIFSNFSLVIGAMLTYGVIINVGMAAFNMIPIPPLDGHWVLQALGPPFIQQLFDTIRPYSFMLLLILINVRVGGGDSLLGSVLDPVYHVVYQAIFRVLSLTGRW